MDSKINHFISKHHLLSLATQSEKGVYCSHAFYAYDHEKNIFIITTDATTRHGSEMASCSSVAASIGLETGIIGKIQGLQINGEAYKSASDEDRKVYLKKYPYAAAMELSLWRIEPTFMKLTDNTLGFGKKIIWNRE